MSNEQSSMTQPGDIPAPGTALHDIATILTSDPTLGHINVRDLRLVCEALRGFGESIDEVRFYLN